MEKPRHFSDEQLVYLIKNGQQEAFTILCHRYHVKLCLMMSSYIQEPATAHDLTQDVLINAFLAVSRFKQHSKFSTWIFRIAKNVIKNHYRQEQAQWTREQAFANEQPTTQASPERDAMQAELSVQVQKAFQNLPAKLRQCYGLHVISGNSYEEISQQLHCPIGTVRSRIHRAREKMKSSIC